MKKVKGIRSKKDPRYMIYRLSPRMWEIVKDDDIAYKVWLDFDGGWKWNCGCPSYRKSKYCKHIRLVVKSFTYTEEEK